MILFADIVGSTRLYENLGNEKARELTSHCLDLVSDVITGNKGTVIKTIGDEVMCVFSAIDKAAETAILIQEKVSVSNDYLDVRLQMKVGFHMGDVIIEKDDVFGDAVNVAARMVAQAKADQIITTSETLRELPPALRATARQLKEVHIHGKDKCIQLCELTWGEVSDLTVVGRLSDFGNNCVTESCTTMNLCFQGVEIKVSQENPQVTFGRGDTNTVVVDGLMVSRRHALVEWRSSGVFYLVDQSTNGIYLLAEDKKKRFVHRDEIQLKNSGFFWLSKETFPDSLQAVRYTEKRQLN
ncbi:adenylate/guanylate cyclase domain-containing protein [Desulfocapsa sulfexigens]|uniref:adenylate/guanylate cyclase domain-containing protein n=1 Tax=Desulfocapsa sulfexigens TaxID=65555 RepID=UPI000344DA23|nr:adenylate/guanylate cyclase domain-containing protein [Desulfocapsa sulfexigens]